ncbi:MAG: glutamyl-tRNA reductase [Planctomycetes bacterium GWF2_41_51]|nr:MAG: glutamyl-tRNA reductase [Planctomycetes bacterium GWF2_41_51]HBG26826.1 glutamyl-tRNA reductase [Phycisphaerales bacterium]
MELFCQGVNFKRCSAAISAEFVLNKQRQEDFLGICRQHSQISDALILNTCNRLEFYFYAEENTDITKLVNDFIGGNQWEQYAEKFAGIDAAEHLFRVAAGLESQIIGENEIFAQLKAAYGFALSCGCVKYVFHHLLHCAFRVAKAVRTQTHISAGALSVAGAAVALASVNREIEKAKVFVIGSGANAELLIKHLIKKKVKDITIVARNSARAAKLGKFLPLSNLSNHISNADIVFASTSSEEPLIKKDMIKNRSNPLILIDISVPANIQNDISETKNVKVFNIDSLNEIISANNARRQNEVPKAKTVVKKYLPQFSNWLKTLNIESMVS